MKTNQLLKLTRASFLIALISTFMSCDSDDVNSQDTAPLGSKYTVSAELVDDVEGYFVTTDNLLSGSISIVGNGYEGYANLSVSLDGYFYDINTDETTIDKYEFTDEGLIKVDAISYGALFPGVFFRYIQSTGTGDLLISHSPKAGELPYIIIDLEDYTLEKSGNLTLPEVDGNTALWAQPIVKDDKIYFGAHYGASWKDVADELITVKYDYPSLENESVITSSKSSGSTAGYRGNGSFVTEGGDIYQFNLNSASWHGDTESTDNPTVFVKITDGDYDDDYVLDVSAEFDDTIAIWNAWYAGDNIVYANVVKESDITAWGDLKGNIGTLVEINLIEKTVVPLNIPQAPYVNVFKVECIDDGKFYVPVSISGGTANIYEITIGGGANGFQAGAVLDGSNVFVNALYNNF